MKSYTVKSVSSRKEVENAEKVCISSFRNGSGYEPKTLAALVYVKGEGLLCRMECFETNPRALVTEINGDTYKDSCMEFFINCAPEKGDDYLNLEGNAIGTLHCKYGKDRYVRMPLGQSVPFPEVKTEIHPDRWIAEYFISLETIKAVFGKEDFLPGDEMTGNFYKCGDETDAPHYGMWSPVTQERLDFHVPAFFGKFIIA